MYKVDTQEMSPEFMKCWQAAGIRIDKQVQRGMQSWLKAIPYGRMFVNEPNGACQRENYALHRIVGTAWAYSNFTNGHLKLSTCQGATGDV